MCFAIVKMFCFSVLHQSVVCNYPIQLVLALDCKNILKLLQLENWIKSFEIIESNKTDSFNQLKVEINYEHNLPKIKSLKRISSPGHRVYVDKNNIPKVLNGWGMAIISTSKGLMTDKQARKEKIGGEVICEIY